MTLSPVHFSNLRWMAKSPAHYKYYLEHPQKQTKPMLYGDALDSLLFGTKEVLVFDGASRRGNAWLDFEDAHPEAVKLLKKESDEISAMLQSLKNHKEAMRLMRGERQKTIKWKIAHRKCEGTADVYRKARPDRVVELKATVNANPDRFQWDARNRGYHAQLSWYRHGLASLGRVAAHAICFIVAVENTPPYPVTIFDLTEQTLLEGTKLWRLWFERLLVCEQTDCWPAYTEAVVPFDVPDSEGLTLKIDGEEVEVE